MRSKIFTAAALAVVGLTGAGFAQAHTSVQWQVTIGGPVAVPVYEQPRPVYAPRVYGPPPAVVVPVPRRYSHPTRWDVDGDGIPNRHDAVYNPVRDRDGDGIRNRCDPRPNHADRGGWRR